MIDNISYMCPGCKDRLVKKEGNDGYYYLCDACESRYFIYFKNGVEIIDFDMTHEKVCQCEIDGYTECRLNLQKELDLLEINVDNYVELKSKKAKLFRRWIGTSNKVLDIGCREAPWGNIVSKDNEAYGIDICPKALLLNQREGLSDNALNKSYHSLMIGNCLSLPMESSQFDVVLATDIIEHIVESRIFVSEIYRVLKKGGKLIVSCPNLVSIYNRLSILVGSGLGFMPWNLLEGRSVYSLSRSIRYPEQVIHVRFFTFDSIIKFFKEHHFKTLEAEGIDPVMSRIGFFDRVFRNLCDEILILAEKV